MRSAEIIQRWRQRATLLRWWWPARRRGGCGVAAHWPITETSDEMSASLRAYGIRVEPYRVDVDAFEDYVDRAGYRSLAYYDGGRMPFAENKWLQHYVSVDLTRPRAGEVLVDVASSYSPFAEIVAALYGVRSYRQDILFPPGADDHTIGGDATAMPVPDRFADVMTLHCSFEHFEGDADMRFIREAGRVLKSGGRLCIIPLYTGFQYAIQSDPSLWKAHPVRFDSDAVVHLKRGWSEVFGRKYDALHFKERIAAQLGGMALTVMDVRNYADALPPDRYLKYAALITKGAR